MNQKHILIFSLAYHPFVGGAEVAIKEITDRISPQDIQFHLITLRFDRTLPKEERIGNVFVHRVGFGGRNVATAKTFSLAFYFSKVLFVPSAALRALRLHRRYRFDAAWAMMTYMLFPIVLMRLCGVRLPYVLTLQEGDPFIHVFGRPHILPFLPLLNIGFRHVSVVQAISNFLGKWARERGFAGPLQIIPNGVDLALFAQERAALESEGLRKRLSIKKSDTMLVTTSRLVHKNAIDDCIRALSFLPQQYIFVVLGTGPEETNLKALAVELRVEDRVRFMGHVHHTDMPQYLHAADLFIRPSRSEGMGNSFIEAFAAGIPVIATQEGGIADFLFDPVRNPEHESTGFAVDKDSPTQIAEVIQKITATDPTSRALVRRVVKNAHGLAIQNYDWGAIALRMRTEVFTRVLTSAGLIAERSS